MINQFVQPHRVPRFHSFMLGVAALILALFAQQQLRADQWQAAMLLFALALVLFVLPFRAQLHRALPISSTLRVAGGWSLLWRLLPGLLALGAAYWSLRTFQSTIESPSMQAWWLHIASLLLMLLFAFCLDWGARRKSTAPDEKIEMIDPGPWRWWQIGVLLAITALALFMRLWRLDELPFGTWYDEAVAGLLALRILDDPTYRPIFEGSINVPAHYLYLIAFFFRTIEVSTQSIRLVSVMMGVAMVGAAYLAGRELFGRFWGLALAFLVAVARWSVNFSRIGMYNISTPLFELLTIGLLLRAFRRGRYVDYALAGLALGLGLCFYVAFQLFVGVIGLFWLWTALVQRGFGRRTWSGMVLVLAVAAVVVMPLALFAYTKPDVYFARMNKTSIFAEETPSEPLPPALQSYCTRLSPTWEARCQHLPMVWENVRKHLLMFNYQGDRNGRHNLPGEPMLDNILAALLVIGVGLCLVRFWRPRAFLLLAWLGIMLLGGILSLGFEAPQSLRAIGTQPVVYLLALVPLYALQQAWLNSGGRTYASFYVLPLCGLLLWSGYANFTTYFYRQAAGLVNTLAEQKDATEVYIASQFYAHPVLSFLARNAPPYQWLETATHLPMNWSEGKNIALILDADSRSLFEEAKHYYPTATFEEFGPPDGGPTVIYYAYLTRDDLLSVQGLQARYYGDDTWSGAPLLERKEVTIRADWTTQPPVPLPFSVEWEGVLNVKDYGTHQISLQAPAYAELYIGEAKVMAGEGDLVAELMLAEGANALRIRAVGAAGPLSLSWRPPDGEREIIPASALFVPPVTSNGLLGKYYANGDWQGKPVLERINPLINLYFYNPILPRPYTVEWSGKIAIPQSGVYRFGLESIDESTLTVDGQEITASLLPNDYQEGSIQLESGLHDIRLRYADRSDLAHVNLYWVPPFGGQQPVPPEVLFPPQANYDRVTMPDLAQLLFDPDAPAPPVSTGKPLGGMVRPIAAGLNQPKGIAVGPDNRLYVADTGNHRVLVLLPDGTTVGELKGPEAFVEPFDIAVGPEGQVYVLDAAAERISIFDRDDSYLRDLPADPGIVGRSRGLHVDRDGRIWIANTPGGRVVALDSQGTLIMAIPVWPGEDSQPVDVAVGSDGSIFVTDSGVNRLVRFDAGGRRLSAWDIPVTNSFEGSHLTVDAAGYLYLSKPEPALVTQLLPTGELVGDWSAELTSKPGGAPVKPIGIAIDSSGRVWYVDSVGGVLYVIEPDVG